MHESVSQALFIFETQINTDNYKANLAAINDSLFQTPRSTAAPVERFVSWSSWCGCAFWLIAVSGQAI